MPRILVTGGCGYIGSHTIVDLLEHQFEVVCLDNLINSSDEVLGGVQKITGKKVDNHDVDLSDRSALTSFFKEIGHLDGIIHFAALKAVGESVEYPGKYFSNNVVGMVNLLDLAVEHGVAQFVFSSSCTVYGDPDHLPVNEDTPIKPATSPYGRTKQIGEMLLEDMTALTPLRAVSLRYFNPAGAHPSAEIGEAPTNPALNLVPIITEAAYGIRSGLKVFGDDYDTRDGTCIRDYIHVCDLARAHTMALNYLDEKPDVDLEVFNLGSGEGTTVLEAIKAFESGTDVNVPYEIAARRAGDVPAIYADNTKAERILGWKAKRGIGEIMKSAWNWEKARRS
jgi:UDP-glucose 4-epimerase